MMGEGLKLRVVYHYSTEDTECNGDYYNIEIFIASDSTPIQTYGDDYHDKGSAKLEGFLDGLRYCGQVPEVVEHVDVADRNY